MNLDPAACEWMKLTIVTTPETTPTDWEASIDDGATWVTAVNVDDTSAWLVAGPHYAGISSPVFVTEIGRTDVKLRLIDSPETIIRDAPSITTTSA